jgi:hypothetical protein
MLFYNRFHKPGTSQTQIFLSRSCHNYFLCLLESLAGEGRVYPTNSPLCPRLRPLYSELGTVHCPLESITPVCWHFAVFYTKNTIQSFQNKHNVLLTMHRCISVQWIQHDAFLFKLLRINGLYMFRALLAHLQEGLHKLHAVYQVPSVKRLLRMSK